jgi:hypothetical protein
MAELEREYRWYLKGCDRLGQAPLDQATFAARWQEFEAHAEQLKAGETGGDLSAIAQEVRAEMQQRVKADPFVKAVLVGMAEDTQEHS